MTVIAPAPPADLAHVPNSAPRAREVHLAGASPLSLVLAARDGDQVAWEELVRRFTPLLWVIARGHRLGRDDAADVVQSTWLRCVERLDQVRDPSRVAAWLVTICRRESLVVLRRRARVHSGDVADSGEAVAAIPDPLVLELADVMIEREERTVLREAILQLPERPRQILLALIDADDDAPGYRGVAQRLDLPVGSIGPTRQRALQRLRRDPRLQGLRDH